MATDRTTSLRGKPEKMHTCRRDFAKFVALALPGLAVPALLTSSALAQTERTLAPTVIKPRRQEAEDLRRFAEATHPDGAAAAANPEWRQSADAFIDSADRLTTTQYPLQAMRLLSWFKDGHTGVYATAIAGAEWALRLPVGCKVFFDGIYITSAKDEGAPLLGARLVSIADIPIEMIARRFAEIWPAAGAPLAHRWLILLLGLPAMLHGLGLVVGTPDALIRVKGQLPDGNDVIADLRPRVDASKDRSPLFRRKSAFELYAKAQAYGPQPNPTEDGRNFVHRLGSGVVYISLDRPGSDDFGQPFDVFDAHVSAELARKNGTRLIIDLRRNGGGDNTLCEPMRKRIQRSAFNRPGGLYVLTAPHTFSAAQNFANRLERETFAVFVGEPTGSSPNHCGDAKHFPHADGGLPAQVSTVRWSDSSPFDDRVTIMPDVLIPSVFKDYLAGRDAALEAALAHKDQRPFDDALLTTPWTRGSQGQAWKPFWM